MDFITLDTEPPNNFNEIVNHLKGNLVPALTVNYESFQAEKVKPETLQLARRKEATAADNIKVGSRSTEEGPIGKRQEVRSLREVGAQLPRAVGCTNA